MKCKNNPNNNYKGNEPSPKGFGWCASGEEFGKKRKGKDGNIWTVLINKNGTKKWYNNNYKSYFTHYNYTSPYLIFVNDDKNISNSRINKSIYIYSQPKEGSAIIKNPFFNYTKLEKKYKPIKIFIGKSPLNKMTKYSKGYGKKFDGNSILLKLTNNKYVFIQHTIILFTINDDITDFISPVGNNDVPYPLAFGKKYVYSFINGYSYIAREEFFKDFNKKTMDYTDAYFKMEPFFISKPFKKPIISLEKFREIIKKSKNDISIEELKQLSILYKITTTGTKKILIDRLYNLRNIIIK